jgi:hypothetical protein
MYFSRLSTRPPFSVIALAFILMLRVSRRRALDRFIEVVQFQYPTRPGASFDTARQHRNLHTELPPELPCPRTPPTTGRVFVAVAMFPYRLFDFLAVAVFCVEVAAWYTSANPAHQDETKSRGSQILNERALFCCDGVPREGAGRSKGRSSGYVLRRPAPPGFAGIRVLGIAAATTISDCALVAGTIVVNGFFSVDFGQPRNESGLRSEWQESMSWRALVVFWAADSDHRPCVLDRRAPVQCQCRDAGSSLVSSSQQSALWRFA